MRVSAKPISGRRVVEALAVSGLVAGYGGGVTLEGLSLSVRQGEAVALIGRNGVGKTTLFRVLMGLVRPISGRVALFGADVVGRQPFEIARRGVAYVPQGREIFAELTVEQNLRLGRLNAPDVEYAYAIFPALREKRRLGAGGLSGGQQQQLALARALMSRPRLLLLDEPSEGVQPSIVAELAEALAGIVARDGLTLLLAEQNLEVVGRLCARALVLARGRIEAEVETARLKDEPERVNAYLAL